MSALELGDDDELLIVDNSVGAVVSDVAADTDIVVVRAALQRSSYYARNVGAETASGVWLLFLDADCRPSPGLIATFFADPPVKACGAVAGEVIGDPSQTGLVARYGRARQHLNQAIGQSFPYRPRAVTANLLVRRSAWLSVGGFLEGIRSGGDTDFSWRLQENGWGLEYRADAVVEHRHREDVPGLARQLARYGASRRWLNQRYPGSFTRLRPTREAARALAAASRWALTGQFERGAFRALDAVVVISEAMGYLASNRAPAVDYEVGNVGRPGVRVLTDAFPAVSETFVAGEVQAMADFGRLVHVEAGVRPTRPDRAAGRWPSVSFLEDDGILARGYSWIRLVVRHPFRCLADRAERGSWAVDEPVVPLRVLAPTANRIAHAGDRHLHVHFAGGAALNALRLSRLLGIPYSLTAHAYDIYREPRNLKVKVRHSAFTTSGCRYTVADLRRIVGSGYEERVHEVIMGVDPARWKRRTPYPGGRTVFAVGRLVEKKGFRYVIDAASKLHGSETLERLVIVGDGPLRRALHDQVARLGLGEMVELVGARDPVEVRELLEQADLLAMPSVVASDGDRDSMPVVVKEAMALEVPVVASDEVGLPELVRPPWGRLVPPGDAVSLGAAMAEVLALPTSERAEMGRGGREWVRQHCDVHQETARLLRLIDAARD